MARVLHGAPRPAVGCFRRQRLGGYDPRRLLGGLVQPHRPTRATSTGAYVAVELPSEVMTWWLIV